MARSWVPTLDMAINGFCIMYTLYTQDWKILIESQEKGLRKNTFLRPKKEAFINELCHVFDNFVDDGLFLEDIFVCLPHSCHIKL